MPKFLIEYDEWFPVYYLDSLPEKLYKSGKTVELTENEVAHIEKVFEEFDKIQQMLEKIRGGMDD
jgi:hypothetical protein